MRLWLVALVLILPSVAAQQVTPQCTSECEPTDEDANGQDVRTEGPVKVFLYPHLGTASGWSPLNTQKPPPGSRSVGPETSTQFSDLERCAEFVWPQTPGLVEYLNEGWRTTHEPGLAAPLPVLGAGNVAYLYARPETDGRPSAAPVSLQAHVLIETGRFVGRGTPLLSGSSTAFVVDGVPLGNPIEFRIPLTVHESVLPSGSQANGFVASVRICNIRTEGSGFVVGGWTLENREEFYNRLILNVDRPIISKDRNARIADGWVFIRASWLPAFGSYDAADDSVTARGTSPNSQLDPAKIKS